LDCITLLLSPRVHSLRTSTIYDEKVARGEANRLETSSIAGFSSL
jgi:hypothetical protein